MSGPGMSGPGTAPRLSVRTALARIGLSDLDRAAEQLAELCGLTGLERAQILAGAESAANADAALQAFVQIARRDGPSLTDALVDPERAPELWTLFGASRGFGDFAVRHPRSLAIMRLPSELPTRAQLEHALSSAYSDPADPAPGTFDDSVTALRVAYREQVARIALFDLMSSDPAAVVGDVARALADAAGAALDACLALARQAAAGSGPGTFDAGEVFETTLSIIGMGKTGAGELNYVSDVDVIFVAGTREGASVSETRAAEIATRLATLTMRAAGEPGLEPRLWEVDANLRPEGRHGALVRSLASHEAYYARWAEPWEFQALLKARPIAGDLALGERFVAQAQPHVWTSATSDTFVTGVQRMRERVTEHIPAAERPRQVKLGPGGIRDVEFAVQLIQLVHGVSDPSIRVSATLPALGSLVAGGYIGRADGDAFAHDYRTLRLIEHRLQLWNLTRTHLMPTDAEGLRTLGRSTRLAADAAGMQTVWDELKLRVRRIHDRLFYRPLLSAVAGLDDADRALTSDEARARLAAIGFRDPGGAIAHIAALTHGLSRRAAIQRQLVSVLLTWFATGVDPDRGLVAYRRISERLGETPWFLRMLRDSGAAAERLATLLSGSRYIGQLLETIPESVAWLDSDDDLRPLARETLDAETAALHRRHEGLEQTMKAVRRVRRRELLRAAMASVLGAVTVDELAQALTDITDVTIAAALKAVRRDVLGDSDASLEFAVIAMGRFGGAELGFGSDADVLYVFRPGQVEPARAATLATDIVRGLRSATEDALVPLELDADLRPEGKNGDVVRTLDAYEAYYRRWAGTWEAQALLRARVVAGSERLAADFIRVADEVRYTADADAGACRDVRRMKARVEAERMPRGADPARHVKLGPGGLSDVEWLVQLLQMQHAHRVPELRTSATLDALRAAVSADLIPSDSAQKLEASWRLASRLRSAHTLASGQSHDMLPTERMALDGIGRILQYPPHSATRVEDDWFRTARLARRAFEEGFFAE